MTETYSGQRLVQKSAAVLWEIAWKHFRGNHLEAAREVYGGLPHLMRSSVVVWPDGDGGEMKTIPLPAVVAELEAAEMRNDGHPAWVRLEATP